MNQWSWNITQNIKKTQHIIPLEILHPQNALHYAAHTQQAMFCGVRTVFTLPPFFLTVEPVSSKLLSTSLWHELTALYCFSESRISCEIHVGRQRSYRCSYKMILQWKHTVHQSTTPFQTERYSRPCHLAASFPFPAHAKNRKTPLPNRPIHRRTLCMS